MPAAETGNTMIPDVAVLDSFPVLVTARLVRAAQVKRLSSSKGNGGSIAQMRAIPTGWPAFDGP
jgi:hypothetical protein